MIKLIIFDLDGVLVDARELHYNALNNALESIDEKYVIQRDEHLSTYDGLTTTKKLKILSKNKGLSTELHNTIHEMKQDMTLRIIDGFSVELTYLAREELLKLRNRSVRQTFNKKTRQYEETLDNDKFLTEYCKAIIKGWKGLTYTHLEELLLVDVSSVDPKDELPWTQENAELLMKNSSDFDNWVSETVGDLENFTQSK